MKSPPPYVLHGSCGLPLVAWVAAKQEVRVALVDCAKKGTTISYSDLVGHVTAVDFSAHDKRLFSLLGQLAIEEHENGRPLLSVLVVHKYGDMQPGVGFFDLAEHLGFDVSSKEKAWIDEVNRVYAYRYG